MKTDAEIDAEWDAFIARLDNSPNGKKSPLTGILQLLDNRVPTNPATYSDIGSDL